MRCFVTVIQDECSVVLLLFWLIDKSVSLLDILFYMWSHCCNLDKIFFSPEIVCVQSIVCVVEFLEFSRTLLALVSHMLSMC